jgi:hypothetical protein
MYKLYIWYPWNFGKWLYKGAFATQQELNKQIKNKRETTYKIIKNNNIIEYHEASSYCWRYGMVKPELSKRL